MAVDGPTPVAAEDGHRIDVVTPPRRAWYATADPEQAHEFLSDLYGRHTLRLLGSADSPGFQFVYNGCSTNRFTVERLSHTMPFEGRFAPGDGLVVLHPVEGDVQVTTSAERQRVVPSDALLVDLGAGPELRWTRLDAEAVRLDPAAVARVAADLNPVDNTVGAIAARWGFAHHGDFSTAYLRAYGYSPSVTLRS